MQFYPAPSYLNNLVNEVSSEILSNIKETYGSNTAAFKFNSNFKHLVQSWIEKYEEYGGTIWGIDEDNNQTIIFDQLRHGYNGMMRINEAEDLRSTKSIKLIMGAELIIAFQYGGDEVEYLREGLSKLPQDYFSWVAVYKYIDKELEEIFNYECA